MMVVFHDIWCMCCVYIRNVQHHIETAILNAARKEILVFHNREQLHVRLRQACTFETKTSGLVSIQTVWHLNFVIVERLFKKQTILKTPREKKKHIFSYHKGERQRLRSAAPELSWLGLKYDAAVESRHRSCSPTG